MTSIITEMFRNMVFTEHELQYMQGKLKKIRLQKKDFLLQEGEEVHDIYYIHDGCLRTYFIDTTGKEHTLQFAIKGWWTSDYIALFGRERTKSVSYIECIKDAVLYQISKDDFDILCDEMPKISRFHIKNLESAFAAFHRRILENLTLSAKERYLNFIKSYPTIEQNVKNYHIASFLGITTESLSRIRREIASE